MTYTFLWIALLAAILDWLAVAKGSKSLEYAAKPGVMLALLVWLWQNSALGGNMLWFGLGLFFSLWGDIFLMLPRERFIAGLIAFLLGHLAYIVGLNQVAPPLNLPVMLLSVMVALVALRLYRNIRNGLQVSGHDSLITPVLVYSLVISLMLLSALLTLVRAEWQAGPALLTAGGALLFFISDSILAWNKFVNPVHHGKILVIISYHLGQMMIVLGAAIHFLQPPPA